MLNHVSNSVGSALPGSGGGGGIGSMVVATNSPGANYVQPLGQMLRVSDYPLLGQGFSLNGGFGFAAGISTIVHPQKITSGSGYIYISSSGNNNYAFSNDHGRTFSVKSHNGLSSGPWFPACSSDGKIVVFALSGGAGNSSGSFQVSVDYGATFTSLALGTTASSVSAIDYFPTSNKFIIIYSTNVQTVSISPTLTVTKDTVWNLPTSWGSNSKIIQTDLNYHYSDTSSTTGRVYRSSSYAGAWSSVFSVASTSIYDMARNGTAIMAATSTGLYFTSNEFGSSALITNSSGNHMSVAYGNGRWISTRAGAATSANVSVVSSDGGTITYLTGYNNGFSFNTVNRIVFTGLSFITTDVNNNSILATADSDPNTQFAISPNIDVTTAASPKKFYMRVN